MEISFGRAIKIESDTNPMWNYKDHKLDPATMAVVETMKGKSSVYDKETSRKIGSFLKAQIGDYNRKTGVYARRINGTPYIFTGEDAEKAREINKKALKEMLELEARYEKGPDENSTPSEIVELGSEKLYKIYRQNVHIRRDKRLVELAEDGNRTDKPYTVFHFKTDNTGKINKIEYYSSGIQNDGFKSTEKSLTF